MRLSAGTRFGTYEIVALVGTGGMGEVYRARDVRLKRDVAIKVLPSGWAGDPDRRARFEREAELLAALNHSNIAAIYGAEDVEGAQALILEFVDGPTLADRLVQGPIPLAEAMAIARQIIDALDAAHEKGIIHRDLKPANVKIRDDGTVKVLDFGLAKISEAGEAGEAGRAGRAGGAGGAGGGIDVTASPTLTAMTGLGVILGTAAYMSPEQARGHAIDKRTDIWAFGCVLYEMLAGRRAFARDSVPDTIAAILEREPDWAALPASTPPALHRLLRRCLEKNRHHRLRDIGDVRFVLDDIAEGSESTPEPRSARVRFRLLAAAALVASVVAIAALSMLWNRGDAQTEGVDRTVGPRFTRLTLDDAFSTEPAISRDGTLVAYASDRAENGQLDLWVQRAAGQPIRLTDDPADDRAPDFSPDGGLIAFRSNRGSGGIYVVPALGGTARLVAEGGHRPRFSPDGTRIAYWTGTWLSGSGSRAAGYSVWTVPANGGQPTRVADGFVTARDPIWAPDGKSLLFFGRRTNDDSAAGMFDWWWVSLDGREPIQTAALRVFEKAGFTADTPRRHEDTPGVWTASGVIFAAQFGESVNLWRIEISPQTGQANPASLERLTEGAGFDALPSADTLGRLAFQVSSEGSVSLTLPLDSNAGRASGPIVRQSFWAGQGVGRNSVDDAGRLLVYQKRRANEGELWVKDLATGQERHLATTPLVQLNPVISHDGSKVAYTLPEGGRNIGYVIPTAGGTAMQVCEGCTLHGWFADNRRILAQDAPGAPGRVLVVDVIDRTSAELVVHPTMGFGRADISPDGRWLSFLNGGRVWVAPLGAGGPVPQEQWVPILATAEDGAERACGWSPDSRLLYLLLERDGFRDLYAQRIDPARGGPVGEPFVVQHLHDPRRRWGSTPFGTAIVSNAFVFNQVEQTGSIWLLDPR